LFKKSGFCDISGRQCGKETCDHDGGREKPCPKRDLLKGRTSIPEKNRGGEKEPCQKIPRKKGTVG